MHLKRLEILGFKSFARKTILDFDRGVTAIVGPNGCGKSNIVDSMKWVLGEQSVKSVRGKKGEDLIFSGSKKKTCLGKARVALFLDNTDNAVKIDFSEIVISRCIFRSGDNEYYINDSKVRLKDVTEILAKARMVHRSFSIINQGMADAILNYSPRERQLILEEAAGVREYQMKKEESGRKMDNAEDNLKKVASLIIEIEPHLKFLKHQAMKAEKREDVMMELRNIQIKYFGAISKKIQKEKSLLDRKKRTEREYIFQKSNELIKLKKNLKKEEENIVGKYNTASKLQREWNDLRLEIGNLERALAKVDARIELTSENERTRVLPVDIDYIKTRISESMEMARQALRSKEIGAARELMKNGLELLSVLFDEITSGKVKKYIKKTEIDSGLLKKKKELEKQISVLSVRADELQADLSGIHNKESKEKTRLFDMERIIRKLEDDIYRRKDELRDLDVQEARVSVRMEEIEKDIRDSGVTFKEISSTDINIDENFDREDAERRIRRLKVQLDEIGGIDPLTIKEFQETNQRYEFLKKESLDLEESIVKLRNVIRELELKISATFNNYFSVINNEFNNYFRLVFGGGRASLLRKSASRQTRSDSEFMSGSDLAADKKEAEAEGIDINAVLPGKNVKDLSLFSGGERSLTSIALLFAIIASSEPPFLVLDEIDAALDEDNSRKFGKILQELSEKTQFILITHNRETMKLANVLYGVTMDGGVSKLLSLKLT